MAVSYSLIPTSMINSIRNPAQKAEATKNLDNYIMEEATQGMHKASTSKKLKGFAKQQKYTSQLKNLMKTKKEVESRPVKVTVTNMDKGVRPDKSPSPLRPSGKSYRGRRPRPEGFATPQPSSARKALFTQDEENEEQEQVYAKSGDLNTTNETLTNTSPATSSGTTKTKTRRGAAKTKTLTPQEQTILVTEVMHLVSNNPEKYGLKDGKIMKPDGTAYSTAKVKDVVSAIVMEKIGAEHGTGKTNGGAVKQLKTHLANDPDFLMLVKRKQTGAGKRRPKAKCQKGKGKQKGGGKTQKGNGRKKKPVTKTKAKPKHKTDFRAEKWRKPGK